jgi:hypothetical protein
VREVYKARAKGVERRIVADGIYVLLRNLEVEVDRNGESNSSNEKQTLVTYNTSRQLHTNRVPLAPRNLVHCTV